MLTIYANCDTLDQPLGVSGVDWVEIDDVNDKIIFTAGSDTVADGEPLPSESQLNAAGVLLTGLAITLDKYFLADNSADELKQIHNMGAGNKRYVLAFDFDDATASEPVLEIWDDTGYDSIAIAPLGAGTPSNSWFYGITTTDALPGVGWVGDKLAGSSDGHFLWLNNENGALLGADTLYAQIKVIIPSTITNAGASTPTIVVKFATFNYDTYKKI